MCHTHLLFVLNFWLLLFVTGFTEFRFHTNFKSVLKILIQSGKNNEQLTEMLNRVAITIAALEAGLCRSN